MSARLGGPDLRAVPAAVATWLAALVGTGLPTAVSLAAAAAVLAVGTGSCLAMRGGGRLRVVAVASCATVALVGGAWRLHALHDGSVAALAADRATVDAEVVVATDPHALAGRVRGNTRAPTECVLRVSVRRLTARGRRYEGDVPVLVVAPGGRWCALVPGQVLDMRGRLRPVAPTDNIAAVLGARSPPVLLQGPGAVQGAAASVRERMRAATAGLSPDVGGLLTGLVDGDTSRLPPVTQDEFRAAGLTHLTAVSGANVAMMLAAVAGLARWAGLRGYAVRVTALLGVAGFVVVARPEPSVVRATAMAVIGVLAGMRGARRGVGGGVGGTDGGAGAGALACSVVLLVLLDPFLARSAGFALSTLATAGLLVLAPGWGERWRRAGVPRPLAESLAVTLAAQVASWPVLVLLSPQLSLASLPANLAAAPAVPAATLLGVLAAVVGLASPAVAGVVAHVAAVPAAWVVGVAHVCAGLPLAQIPWLPGVAGAVAAVLAMVLVRLVGPPLLHRPYALAAAVVATALLLPGSPVRPSGWPPQGWLLVACDVGQGDALVLSTGPGRAVVVDAGPDPAPVDRCLRDLGVRQVPLVVLTHFHADHVEGLPGVLRGRAVAEVEVSPLAEPPDEARRVRAWAGAAEVRVTVAGAGEVRNDGDVRWSVLWPRRLIHEGSPPNNASVVLRVETGGHVLLLTGDVEAQAQDALLGDPSPLRADVLKVPHHGSANQDAAFLSAVAPAVALVSVGVGNPYGHPAPSTLHAMAAAGVVVGRTDEEGDLAVVAYAGRAMLVPRRPP